MGSPTAAAVPVSVPPSTSTCSTEPDHGPNHWIDFTEHKRASQFFSDPKAAALADAAGKNDVARMQQLIRDGADVNAQGEQHLTVLDWALRRGSTRAFAVLLDAGADPTKPGPNFRNVVGEAAAADDTAFLRMLIDRHENISDGTPDGYTPLSLTIITGCDKQFHMLILAGADLNRTDSVGDTALHTAASINAFDRQLDLLHAGSDPLARNRVGFTFQKYLNTTPPNVMSKEGLAKLAAINAWLTERHVPLEEPAKPSPWAAAPGR